MEQELSLNLRMTAVGVNALVPQKKNGPEPGVVGG
jgi:hypothetical protein